MRSRQVSPRIYTHTSDSSSCTGFRILVLDQGKVVEFGTPWELMQKEDGTFRDLCRQSGEEAQLFEVSSAEP